MKVVGSHGKQTSSRVEWTLVIPWNVSWGIFPPPRPPETSADYHLSGVRKTCGLGMEICISNIYIYIYIYMIPCILITTVYGWWFYSTFVFEFPFFGKDHHRPSCTLPSFIFSGKCSQQTIPVFSCVASGWLPTSFSSSSTAVEVPEQTKPLRPQKCEINTCRAGRNIAKKPMKATSTQKENNKNPRSATWYFLLFGFASTRKAMLIFQLVKSIRHQNIALVSTSAAKKTHQWLRMQFSIPALFRPSLLSSFTFRGKCPSIFYRANRWSGYRILSINRINEWLLIYIYMYIHIIYTHIMYIYT